MREKFATILSLPLTPTITTSREGATTFLMTTETSTTESYALRLEGVSKRFTGVIANNNISLQVRRGSFHAIIGENGAGKSTLLNLVYGRYAPDEGRITIFGEDVTSLLKTPAVAISRGIGLVSQHYSLIPALTVLENMMLGAETVAFGDVLDQSSAERKIRDLCKSMNLGEIDLSQKAERLSIAAGQKAEILKALYRNAKILLLDEPTATLAPQEADTLFKLLHTLLYNETTIIFVTHKLQEVLKYSDSVTVLRSGAVAGDFITAQTDENQLLSAMIGREIAPKLDQTTPQERDAIRLNSDDSVNSSLFAASNVCVRNSRGAIAVSEVNFEVRPGEIVGIAGVDGSGQRELSEAIVGLLKVESGNLTLKADHDEAKSLVRLSVRQRQRLGISYIPEDRHRSGMILDFSLAENYLLGSEDQTNFGGGALLNPKALLGNVAQAIKKFDIRIGERDGNVLAKFLSGGNQQKLVVARALASNPKLLIACQPTRGLDIEAGRFVYKTLEAAKKKGLGILLFSLDLGELLKISDRILVMFDGKIVGELSRSEANSDSIGRLMTGGKLQNSQKPQEEGD